MFNALLVSLLLSACLPSPFSKESNPFAFAEKVSAGARAPSFGDPSIDLFVDDGPYENNGAEIYGNYYGYEGNPSVSFETENANILNYVFSEDYLSFSVAPLSNVCSLVITISDGTVTSSRELVGYSTQYGAFYDVSLNFAKMKYASYLFKNGIIGEEQFDSVYSHLYNASEQTTIDPTVSYSPITVPSLGLKGTLTWKDPSIEQVRPLRGVQIELIHFGFFGLASVKDEVVYTDEQGRYEFTYSPKDDVYYYIRVLAKNKYAGVSLGGPDNYPLQFFSFNKEAGHTETAYCFEQNNDFSKALSVCQILYYGGKYASAISGSDPDFINVYYPSVFVDVLDAKKGGATTGKLISGIHLGSLTYRCWDLILHEYGHWLQELYGFFPEILAKHNIDGYSATNLTLGGNHDNLELTWQEAWPTVFALRVTQFYSNYLGGYPLVNDCYYQGLRKDGTYFVVDLENAENGGRVPRYGDGSELTIGAVLYDMYDSEDNETFDTLHLSDSLMWELVLDSKVKNFSDFCRKVYSYGVNQDSFGKLLSRYGMAVDNIVKNDSWTPTVSPNFILEECNSSEKAYNPFATDRFRIEVYDSNLSRQNLILVKTITSVSSFYFSVNEWDTIIHSFGLFYSLRICSIRTNPNYPSGDYWSKPFEFRKPTNNISSSSTFSTSTRIQQSAVDLYPYSYYERTLSFAVSGYKVFQTLGSLKTKMYVYNSSGSLIAYDAADGYGDNALVGLFCDANVNYKIKVALRDQRNSGKIRLLVTASPGFRFDYAGNIERYEDIVNLSGGSWIYSCWALQYESLMITYTPGQSGYHTISLTSVFDNYLYVIDPRSAESMFDYGTYEYNDNGGSGKNARLHKHLDQGVPYLIVFCQNNPAKPFTNLDEGDDLEIKIEVG